MMDNQISPGAPVPTALPASPPLEKSNDWFKILLIIIGFLIVLGLFGNIYLLTKKQKPIAEITSTPTQIAATPTPDLYTEQSRSATASWKTHRNTKFGWEFRYLSGWEVKPAREGGEGEGVYGDWILNEPGTNKVLFEIGITGTGKDKESCYAFIDPNEEFKTSKVVNNNIEWVKRESAKSAHYWHFREKTQQCISVNHVPLSDLSLLSVLDKILSTFRFY